LDQLARHQFLTAAHLTVLSDDRTQDVAPMLGNLVARSLVNELQRGAGMASAYALSTRGARLLHETGGPLVKAPNKRKSLFMLDHELALADVAVVFHRLHRSGLIRLLRWEASRTQLGDSAWVRWRGEHVRVPLVPDALAILEHDGRVEALLIEVDRGTVGIPRMSLKYAGFRQWWSEDGAQNRFGVRGVRVLTVAPGAHRLRRLQQSAHESTGGHAGGLLWFITQDSFDIRAPSRLFSAPCFIASPTVDSRTLWSNASRPSAAEASP